ncbi:PREDICTED: CGG triplet repeat-binding protein 1-like [Gavialis gangeticus]|uniref:CGG triplet repeat-binding protein 1-like n=1 Tax=Gavialis gangeticus TaxID=94835 RepID=UPI00092EA25D|nr:PREDICTED: CGG triplet repeat-binding protein 1-like [Gavialis gangeticus]
MKAKKSSKAIKYVSALDRARQYPAGTLQADGGRVFCASCSVTLDALRKTNIDRYLESEAHMKWKAVAEAESQSKKQATMSSLFKRTTESSLQRHEAAFSPRGGFMAADIPREKVDHPS